MSTIPLVGDLAGETLDWMGNDHTGPDPFDELLAFTLASYVDRTAITSRGFDVTSGMGVDR